MALKLVFMGTPDFAVPPLRALAGSGHDIIAVYTQPPRKAGRGKKINKSPVHRTAEALDIPVFHPQSLKTEEAQRTFRAHGADVAVVAAYGLILPKAILEAPEKGCINIHASLLPRWRGAAPIQRAILAGDSETGITIMHMDEGLDTGPVYRTEYIPIGQNENAGSLHDRLARAGAHLVTEVITALNRGVSSPTPQADKGATYANKIEKSETLIDWSRPAGAIHRQVRAFSPRPGAWNRLRGERIKVLSGNLIENRNGDAAPGTILDGRMTVKCGEGAYQVTFLQREGKAPMSAESFLKGFRIPPGTRFEERP